MSTEGENLGVVITMIVFSKAFNDAKIITKIPFGQHGDFGKDVYFPFDWIDYTTFVDHLRGIFLQLVPAIEVALKSKTSIVLVWKGIHFSTNPCVICWGVSM